MKIIILWIGRWMRFGVLPFLMTQPWISWFIGVQLRLSVVARSRLGAPSTSCDAYCTYVVCLKLYGVVLLIYNTYVSFLGCVCYVSALFDFVCIMVVALSIKLGESLFWHSSTCQLCLVSAEPVSCFKRIVTSIRLTVVEVLMHP